MLGDNPEKSKNPLKKAMRRRNAKTVTFSAPTYFEASDVDYSTDEEQEGDNAAEPEPSGRSAENENSNDIQDEDMVVEPLRPKPKEKAVNEPEPAANDMQSDRPSMDNSESSNDVSEKPGKFCHGSYQALDTDVVQPSISVARGTGRCGIRTLSSRTIRWKPRRFP